LNTTSDTIVIGGGINGVSITYQLASRGAKVTLLEKRFIAGGPTGLSSAIVRQHYSNIITARMARSSLEVWQDFNEFVGGECGFTKTGFILCVSPQDVDGLKANISMQQSVGINTRFISVEDIHEIEPFANTRGLGGAAYESGAGYCDPSTAANSYAQAASRLGAELRTGVRAIKLRMISGKIEGVETDQGFFPAKQVIIACGPWSRLFLSHLGIDVPIIAARVKIGFYRRPQDFVRHCIWGDTQNQIYLRPESGMLMLVGSISPDEAEDQVEDPDYYNDRVDLDTLTDFAERAVSRFPAMERSHLTQSYAALYDITPDWHSIMDKLPGYEDLYICAGSSGHGFKLAPAVGEMMARLVLEGKQQDDDINFFSFDRFNENRLVKGQFDYKIIG
jgi:glycine/D-amino acid oxidase-like deaminating enzyme